MRIKSADAAVHGYATQAQTTTQAQRTAHEPHVLLWRNAVGYFEQLSRFRQTLWAWLIVTTVLLLAVMYLVTRWSLRPLHKIGLEVKAIEDQQQTGFEQDYPDYDGADWSYAWQGVGTIPEERSEGTVELLERFYAATRTPRILEDDRLQRINCCDVVDLDFEEILIQAFIRTVKNFQEFSDTVEVFLTPRDTEWIDYPPEAQARLDAALDRIARETGVTIRNLQIMEGIDSTSFSDTTHLTRYGGEIVFTDHLVDLYEPLLRR